MKMSWAAEREHRIEHLAELPGKAHHERFEALNRASRLFSANGVELHTQLSQFVGSSTHVSDLDDTFEHEVVRLFHNYIASVGTLRDVQRATHRKVWPSKPPRAERPRPDDQRTYWEIETYAPQVKKSFGDSDIQFLFDLRNCTVHHSVPMVSLASKWSWGANRPFQQANTAALKRTELDKFSGWSSASKRFLKSEEGDIDFLPLLRKYSQRSRLFFQWFWDQVEDKVRTEMEEYRRKSTEFGLWLAEENALPDFDNDGGGGNPIPGTIRRNRARARLERAAFGTTNWGTTAVDREGVAIVAPSDWQPLPVRRRLMR